MKADRLLVLFEGDGPVAATSREATPSSPVFHRPGTRLALVVRARRRPAHRDDRPAAVVRLRAGTGPESRVTTLAVRDGRLKRASALRATSPLRSMVVRDRLYTRSDAGLGASRLDTLAPVGFAAFA